MTENENAHGKIIEKAWRDPAFKAQLIANPAAALKAEGIELPEGVTVTVVEDGADHFHMVLPPAPAEELSDEDLEAVAGGVIGFRLFARMLVGSAARRQGGGGGGGGSNLTEEQRRAALKQMGRIGF